MLLFEVSLQTGKVVSSTSIVDNGKFHLKVEKRTIDFVEHLEAKYVLVATGSSKQVKKFILLFFVFFFGFSVIVLHQLLSEILLSYELITGLLNRCPAWSLHYRPSA